MNMKDVDKNELLKEIIKPNDSELFKNDIIEYRVPFNFSFVFSLQSDRQKKLDMLLNIKSKIDTLNIKNLKYLWFDLDFLDTEMLYPTSQSNKFMNLFPEVNVDESIIHLEKDVFGININKKISDIIKINTIFLNIYVSLLIKKFHFVFIFSSFPINFLTAHIYFNDKIDTKIYFISNKYHHLFKELNKFKILNSINEIVDFLYKEIYESLYKKNVL